MNRVGFLKEELDKVIIVPEIHLGTILDDDLRQKTIDYLSKGMVILSYMEISTDELGNNIAPLEILTDGNWVWPSYFQFFLKRKLNLRIDDEFINFIRSKDFVMDDISTDKLKELQHLYLNKKI